MCWKYTICIHMIDGKEYNNALTCDSRIENKDELASSIVSTPFTHFVNGDEVTIINLKNVTYITITETQLAF